MTENKTVYKLANTENDFENAKKLFLQYADALGIDLCFQNFSNELSTIHTQYNKPSGALLLACIETVPVGCVGIRKIDIDTAELKRMFVKPEFRNLQIGKKLLEQTLGLAKELGYKKIRLDTLSKMTQALKIYRSAGFYEIQPYYHNPIPDAVFMEKQLAVES